jgi:hypothetical protein
MDQSSGATERQSIREALAQRIEEIAREQYGENGGPLLAARLGIPYRTFLNYISGVTIPAEILLKFIDLTRAHPAWLLNGEEPRYTPEAADDLTVPGDGMFSSEE